MVKKGGNEMKFVLYESNDGGWYKGQNKKYYDMFDLTASKQFAKVFETEEEFLKVSECLNKVGYNFVPQIL